jgi:uncharacterized protein YndB with AHSA1/START domain
MSASRELLTVRDFDAPRSLVWKAWTDPHHLARWWGPKGFTNTFDEFDFRVGGHWRFTMHGPDGTGYPNHIVFQEIAEPARLVMDHISLPHFLITVTFEDLGGRTRVSFSGVFDTEEVFQAIRPMATNGNEEMFDRLREHLAGMD